jgi:hypothetical protein
VKEKA